MSREKFLKLATKKRSFNKNHINPSMRIEALLGATCKRLRQERKQTNRVPSTGCTTTIATTTTTNTTTTEEFHDEIAAKKMRFDVETLNCVESERNINTKVLNSKEFTTGIHNTSSRKELSLQEACTILNDQENISSKPSLWDDPKQVEDFLKLVNAANNNIKNNGVADSGDGKRFELDIADDLLDINNDETATSFSKLVTNYDVSSFTVEFDNLYKDLVQNLMSVETYITQPTCT